MDRCLVLASLARPRPADVEELGGLLAGLDPGAHDALRARIRHNDVGPQVRLTLARNDLLAHVDPRTRAAIDARAEEVRARNLRRQDELRRLLAELAARGVEVMVLKGVLFAHLVWEDPGYKKMNDVDVLIRPEHVPAVLEVFRARGYVPLVLFEGGDPEDLDPEATHHLPSFVSRDFEFVIGTHWGLVSPKAGIRIDYERLWGDARAIPFLDGEIWRMSSEDVLLHLAVHFHHYKTGVKELSDVYNWAHHEPPDWTLLAARLREAGAAGRGLYALRLADALHPLGPEDALGPFFEALEDDADPFRREDLALRLSRPHLLTRSRSLYESRIEKTFTRLLVERWFHARAWYALVFWRLLLFPPLEVLARTNVEERVTPASFPRLWVANLRRTGRVMSRDMGSRPWPTAAVVTLGLVLASLPNYLRPPEDDPVRELREAAGRDPEKIARLMDFLE